jgi:hypothetical protein
VETRVSKDTFEKEEKNPVGYVQFLELIENPKNSFNCSLFEIN